MTTENAIEKGEGTAASPPLPLRNGEFMEFTAVKKEQWPEIKEIYLEAFPKRERKPYLALRHSVRRKKALVMAACDGGRVLGFTVLIPYQDMVMVDYLAVSSQIRSSGTGSFIMKQVCRRFAGKKVVLLIERLDEAAENREQRIARRKFYEKNGFSSSRIFITGAGGEMEILNYGGTVSPRDYLSLQKYALGNLFFRLSHIRIVPGGWKDTAEKHK